MANSEMTIRIEEDGTITVITGDIAEQHHFSADEFLDGIEALAGGKRKTTQRVHDFWNKRKVLRGGKIVMTG